MHHHTVSQAPSGTSREGLRHARAAVGLAGALLVAAAGGAAAQSPSAPATAGWDVTDDTGTVVAIAATPQRVVSLSPAITEIVFALGAGDRLVGGTDFDDYPAGTSALLTWRPIRACSWSSWWRSTRTWSCIGHGSHARRRHRPDAGAGLPGGHLLDQHR
ncbi:MAG: hypothetical protein U0667_06415 [Chloroflexota bacterium]